MKEILFIVVGMICAGSMFGVAGAAESGKSGHRVVFEIVTEVPKQHEALLNNIENVLKALGAGTEVMVIAHGGGLSLLQKQQNDFADRMEKLSRRGVTFAACENTMKKKNVSKEDLLAFVTTVDSGVAEVVRRQEAGWSYIKSGG